MGDISEMMLDGTLCCQCGEFLESDLGDFPQMCAGCAADEELMTEVFKEAQPRAEKNVKCPHCNKRFRGQWARNPDGAEAVREMDAKDAEIARLEKACAEWAETSQANYQRAKKAEAEAARLRVEKARGQITYLVEFLSANPDNITLLGDDLVARLRAALKGGDDG